MFRSRCTSAPLAALLAVSLLPACSDSDSSSGSGSAEFTTWGEEYIEQGIPASEFADGWNVTFDRFLIIIGDVTVADSQGTVGDRLDGTVLYDLHTPGPHAIGSTADIEAKRWDDVGFVVVPAASDTTVHDSATAADLTLMQDGGYGVYAAGSATNGTDVKTFAWGFTLATQYGDCQVEEGGSESHGVVITNGGVANVELTMHGDHLFYDSFGPDAVLRFEAMADADADDDGEVTLTELDAVPLANLTEGAWDAGGHNVNTLAEFVVQLTTTLGHYQGEGHCMPSSL